LWHAAVTAQQAAIRIGSNHSDGIDLAQIEWSKSVFVLEQRDGFTCCRQCQTAMLVAANYAPSLFRIYIRVVEQSHLEFPEQHRRNQFFELRFLEHALLHQLYQ